jgi:hypothetical protein
MDRRHSGVPKPKIAAGGWLWHGKVTLHTARLRQGAHSLLTGCGSGIVKESKMKKFFLALLTIAALSGAAGAILVVPSSPAAAEPPDPC